MRRILTCVLMIAILLASGCIYDGSTDDAPVKSPAKNDSSSVKQDDIVVDHIEVIHFHGMKQCYSCKTVGDYAEETISTYFADEVNSGKITFQHINYELPENRDMVLKYGVKSSSLWIGTYAENDFHPEENANVWYKIRDKEDYMNYLTGIIEKRLSGDFS